MIVEAKCKFCGCLLSITVDDDYGKLGDPYNLLPLAACNRCADYREKRRIIFAHIRVLCLGLIQGEWTKKEDIEKVRLNMEKLLKNYIRIYAKYKNLEEADWDEAILEAVMSKPKGYVDVLINIPAIFKPMQGQLV